MEYFEGILFLTTNRFEVIDSAFKSRIHLAISYPPLSSSFRKQLWRNLITKACNDSLPRWATERFLKKVAHSEVNGREINNIVRMAHGLARAGKRDMRSEDVFKGIAALELFDKDFKNSQSQIKTIPKRNEPDDGHARGSEVHSHGFLASAMQGFYVRDYLLRNQEWG
ncbi:hypothetical protein Daus18300_001466 [Diaporthe australafricana]|uniref:ATPase AAA-type core domain-containing protein n=1 Tax=Diaporthe australafricana TaxID=127596 RepID=A0ABR3XVR9_9PEZI